MNTITNRYVISAYETTVLLEAWGTRNAALLAAIVEATNRARLYIVPCEWKARFNATGQIIVTRSHNAPKVVTQ